MLEHGGRLNNAIKRYGGSRAEWLDLSTGINPFSYPVPVLSAQCWHRLPEASDALLQAATHYYGAAQLLPVAGSQAAIQGLPRLLRFLCRSKSSNVVVGAPSYAEHAHAWQQAGHTVRQLSYDQLEAAVFGAFDRTDNGTDDGCHEACDVMVLCNPNNPTGEHIAPQRLLAWVDKLAQRGAWLIVDEAFCDTTPDMSVIAAATRPGLIVLRSLGKFFGLAGVRLGFVAAEKKLLTQLADFLGPWTVSTAAQEIGVAALSDTAWQVATRQHLINQGKRLHHLLAAHEIHASGCALFQYWQTGQDKQAADFAEHMAQQGIWIRQFAHGVRLGLPADENAWCRLQHALEDWKNSDGGR